MVDLDRLEANARRGISFPPSWVDEAPSPDDTLALVTIARAAQEYIDADARHQRRIDTQNLREAFALLAAPANEETR